MSRFASRSIGAYRAQFYSQVAGTVILSAYMLFSGEWARGLAEHGWNLWAWTFAVALLITLASLAFFEAFRTGALAIVSPIVGSFAAVTTLLSLLAGERFDVLTALGLGVSLFGVALASSPPGGWASSYKGLPPGVGWALFAALTYGTAFWMMARFVVPEIGGVIPIWLSRLLGPILLLVLAGLTGRSLVVPKGSRWDLAVAVGILGTIASVSVAVGSALEQVAVVTVLGSLSAAVTILLALTLLRERLVVHQWIGVVAALVGIVLLGS